MDADADPRRHPDPIRPGAGPRARLRADPDQLGEVWWPAGLDEGSAPALVMVIHGGFWQAEWDRVHARPMAAALADAGYIVCSVEYRRIGSPGGGGWPGTFDDIATAVDRLPEMINDASPAGRTTSRRRRSSGTPPAGTSRSGRPPVTVCRPDQPWHSANPPGAARDRRARARRRARAGRSRGRRRRRGRQLVGGRCDDRSRIAMPLVDPAQLLPSGVPTVVVHGDRGRTGAGRAKPGVRRGCRGGGRRDRARAGRGRALRDRSTRPRAAWPTVLAALDRVARPRPTA